MCRIAQLFELDPDDFLPDRPEALTPERLAQLEVDPAPWALAAVTKIGGRRHEKRKTFTPNYGYLGSTFKPCKPFNSGTSIVPLGPRNPYYNPDADDARQRAIDKHLRKNQKGGKGKKGEQPSVYDDVLPGNLAVNDDYRFWKGLSSQMALKNDASCRWCSENCVGAEAMRLHNTGKDSKYCKDKLLALYKYAKGLCGKRSRLCFVCKADCGKHEYWGIALCRSASCINRWKFTMPYQLLGYAYYRDSALEAQHNDPKTGPYANIPASELVEGADEIGRFGTPC